MSQPVYNRRLQVLYAWYTAGFILFILLLAAAERLGMTQRAIGYVFMFATVALYAGIGMMSRTADMVEYYVAGRRVPAFFNGMATGADWMSAASFIGMAGTLYHDGFQGLAFVLGWTGGFCLVALLLAPYLRKFGQYTIPDFLGARYGGNFARFVGAVVAILASFTYVVAQIYGVGLIASRVIGIDFEIGAFVGLAGILVCSFLGGMRAVTWTQVAQYIILIIAYLLPVVILSQKVTGVPVPQVMYGGVLQKLGEKEKALFDSPKEIEARTSFKAKSAEFDAKLATLPGSLEAERKKLTGRVEALKDASYAPAREIFAAEKALRELPRSEAEARVKWDATARAYAEKAVRPQAHAEAYPGSSAGKDERASDIARRNFIALVICLMFGTAALPHILMRYYTTYSVREARNSVFWSLFFISLLYFTAPAYAVFAKWEVYNHLVGSSIAALPNWIASWSKVGLVGVEDINGDGILQLAELTLLPDVIVLATPEIAGLPYVISGLVAAGGLAAALSTADGLLLTISNALAHDIYYKMIARNASTQRRLLISKAILLAVAMVAAWVASLKPESILLMVGLAFSIAAAGFFPALVCGVFWRRANQWGAIIGMISGLSVTLYYAVITHPFFGGSMAAAWFDIQPISCGIFGLPVGFAAIIIISLLTKPPPEEVRRLVESVRYPSLRIQGNNPPSSAGAGTTVSSIS
ncbi:MAG: VC_2705 family sodium/solute symporter [Sterolibacterium sp.]